MGLLKKLLRRKHKRTTGIVRKIEELGGSVKGLVHVGANKGQEAKDYGRSGVEVAVYIEPIDEVFETLRLTVAPFGPGHIPVKALCAEQDGLTVDFHIASNEGESSSMLDFGWARDEHPDLRWTSHRQLVTRRLDSLLAEFHDSIRSKINLLVMDTQGTEMRVLEGAPELLRRVDWIYTEVNEGGLYEGDRSFEEVFAYLAARQFRLKELRTNRHRWGDALFGRRKVESTSPINHENNDRESWADNSPGTG